MQDLIHFGGVLAFALYCAASGCYLLNVARRKEIFVDAAYKLFISAFLAHTIGIVSLAISDSQVGLVSGGDYYFLLSWTVAASHLLGARKFKFPIIGAFVAPAVAVLLASSSYMMHVDQAQLGERVGLLFFVFHVIPALCAEVCLFFSFVASSIYCIQEKRLRAKKLDSFDLKGPSLDRLDFLVGRFVLFGFLAMGLAVISGAVWAVSRNLLLLTGDFSQWASLAAWILLGLVLQVRHSSAWSSRRVARFTVGMSALYFFGLILVVFSGRGVLHVFGG